MTTTTTTEEGRELEEEGVRREASVEGDRGPAPTTVEPPPQASLIRRSGSPAKASFTTGSIKAAAAVAAASLSPLDAPPIGVEQGDGGEALPSTNDSATAMYPYSCPPVVVPSPTAANGALLTGVPNRATAIDTATTPTATAAVAGRDPVPAPGKSASELVRKDNISTQSTSAAAATTEAFPLGDTVDADGDTLMEEAATDPAPAAVAAGVDANGDADAVVMIPKSRGDRLVSTLAHSYEGGRAMANGDGATGALPAAAVASSACLTAPAVDVQAKVVKPDSATEAVAATAEKTTASAAVADETAAVAAADARREADGTKADKAAAAEARQKGKADDKRAKRACEEACLRLLETCGSITTSTRGWSVEQLLALRGGTLELGAALCGRGMPRAKAGSAAEAVNFLMRYVDRRLP